MEWTGARLADTPTVEVAVSIDAPPEAVWAVVTDPARMPGFSPELQEAGWLDGASGPEAGARLWGRNAHPAIGEWTTTSVVVACEAPRVFGWAVGDPGQPAASWRFTLAAEGEGTRLTQWMQLGPGPSGLTPAIEAMPDKEPQIVHRRLQEHEANMTRTLAAIKAAVEAPGAAAVEAPGAAAVEAPADPGEEGAAG